MVKIENVVVADYIGNYCRGDLNLAYTETETLSEGFVVEGSLDITRTKIKTLPEGLVVGGCLDISRTEIKDLPAIEVGSISAEEVEINSISPDFRVHGYIEMYKCKIKSSFPKGIVINGLLNLERSIIDYLPEGLKVKGDLILDGTTNLKALPEGLVVGGCLDINGTDVEKIPSGLIIGGDLSFRNSPIKILPEGLVVWGNIYPSSQLKSLPEGLVVGENLDLRGTAVKKIPPISVGGTLYIDKGMELDRHVKYHKLID